MWLKAVPFAFSVEKKYAGLGWVVTNMSYAAWPRLRPNLGPPMLPHEMKEGSSTIKPNQV